MPIHTLTIPQTTLPIGQTIFGPVNVGSNTEAQIVVDRTVVGGLASLTAATTCVVQIQSSADNGVTWHDEAGATWTGGPTSPNPRGQTTTATVDVRGIDQNANRVRVLATVAGPSSVVVAGTITVS